MPRRARSLSDVRAKYAPHSAKTPRRRRQLRRDYNGLDWMEVLTAVCKFFCKGHTATEITAMMRDRHKVEMPREEPYQLLSYAASQGWIRFVAPYEHTLRGRIKRRCRRLELEVVHTAVFDDVGYHAAEMLVDLLQKHREGPYNKEEVHIGFAGGHALRKVAQALAGLLRRPTEGLPKTVVFHAMVAGFDVNEPSTDPNAFFTYFLNDPAMQVATRFVGLHAPAVVRTEQFQGLRELEGIKETYDRAKELDIIVTSASLWPDEHSMLRRYMSKSPESLSALEAAGCVGDMLWRPLGADGPIEIDTDIRAMTLLELSDLPKYIKRGKDVLLVLGPCGGCNAPKGGVLSAVLNRQPRLITHLVVDSRAAREYLNSEPRKQD